MEFSLGWLAALGTVMIGYIGGLIHAHYVQRQDKKLTRETKKIFIPQEPQTRKETPKPKIELGAINRPSIEDIEKETKPLLKEEEEAWDEIMPSIIK